MSNQIGLKPQSRLSKQQSGSNLRAKSPSPHRSVSNNSSKVKLPGVLNQNLSIGKDVDNQYFGINNGASQNQSSKQLATLSPNKRENMLLKNDFRSGARIKFKEASTFQKSEDPRVKEGVTSPRSGGSSRTKPRQLNKQLISGQSQEDGGASPKSSSSNAQHAQMIQAQQQRKSFYANMEKYEGFLQEEGAQEDKHSSKMQNKFETIKAILNKSNNQRSDHDLEKLVPLIKTIEFFYQRDIKDSDFSEIVQCLQYEHMEKGKDVFEYNSMGDKFYIILKGTVSVMIPNPDHKDFKRKFEEFQKHRQIIEQGKNTLNSLQQTKEEHQSFIAGNQRAPQSQSPNSHHIHHLAKLNSTNLKNDLQPLELLQRKHQSLIHPLFSSNQLPYQQAPPVNSSANKLMAALQAGLTNKIRSMGGAGLNMGLTVGGASLNGSFNGSIKGFQVNESTNNSNGETGASPNVKQSQFSPGNGQGKRKLLQSKGKTVMGAGKNGQGVFKMEVLDMEQQERREGQGLVDAENREESDDEASEEELEDGVNASVGNQYESGQGSMVQNTQRDQQAEINTSQPVQQARPSLKTIVSKISFTKRMIRESQNYMKRSTKSQHNEVPLFIEAVQLKAGKSFGELALIKNKPRAATIKCVEDCHFAVMSQADYNKVLNKIEQKNMTRIVEFLHELPFFKVWTRTALSKLYYSFEQRNLQRNQVLFRENQEADTVYIVQTGEFEVTKRFKREHEKEVDITRLLNQKKNANPPPQVGQNAPGGPKGSVTRQETNVYEGGQEYDFNGQMNNKKEISSKTKQEKMFKSGYNSSIQLASRQRNVETFKIAILGAGQMFGEDDLIHEREYTTTVICRSNVGQVFAIKASEFLRRLKSNEECWKVILQQVQLKDQMMKNRLSKIDYVFHKEVHKVGPEGKGGNGKGEPRKQKYPSILQKYQIKATQDRLEDFRDTIKEIVSNGNSPNQGDQHKSNFYNYSAQNNRRQGIDSSQRSTSPPVNNSLSKYTTLFSQTYDNRQQQFQNGYQIQVSARFSNQKGDQSHGKRNIQQVQSQSPPYIKSQDVSEGKSLFGFQKSGGGLLKELDQSTFAAKLHTDNMLSLRSNFNSLQPNDKPISENLQHTQIVNPYVNSSFQEQQNFSFTHSVQFEQADARIIAQDSDYSPVPSSKVAAYPQNLLSRYVKNLPKKDNFPDQKLENRSHEEHAHSLPRRQQALQNLLPKTSMPSQFQQSLAGMSNKLNNRSYNTHNQTNQGEFKLSLQKGMTAVGQDLGQQSLNQYDSLNHLSIDKQSPRQTQQLYHSAQRYSSNQKATSVYGGQGLINRSFIEKQSSNKMFSTTYEKQKAYMSVAHTLKPSTGRGGRRNIKSLIQTQYSHIHHQPSVIQQNSQQTPYLTPQHPTKNHTAVNATISHITSHSQPSYHQANLNHGKINHSLNHQQSNHPTNLAIYQKSLFLMTSNGGYQLQTQSSLKQQQNLKGKELEIIGQLNVEDTLDSQHNRAYTAAVGVRAAK